MMTMYDPVFPTVKQVVASVKHGFSQFQSWRQKRQSLQVLNDIPEHLRADLNLDQKHVQQPVSANDAYYKTTLRWK
ncbi:hypothetical protein KCN56_21410 [Photobacterium galatheae]|uniref:DUF1127 domain-containing protein n=1 Tax=Photobacterium galatheae TaxID=1654360 RepID=A0A066RR09_9GAMM|nr:hypothetical protein [Photobacterium galatheae]KDM89823.1 hypothetical protein EA58_20445 [Photobacterium galatheae]MCM0151120.1 hypothetical protein [Photobacterium galatheae]